MANLNKVLLIGNITRDLELKYLPNQTAACDFGLAINRNWTAQDGTKKQECTFVDCTAFGRSAEVLVQFKKKGDPLYVEGRLKLDQWEAQDGSKRQKMRVIVDSFQFLNRAQQQQQDGGGGYRGEEDEQARAPRQSAPPKNNNPYGRPVRGTASQTNAQKIMDPPTGPRYDDGGPSEGSLDADAPLSDEDIPF